MTDNIKNEAVIRAAARISCFGSTSLPKSKIESLFRLMTRQILLTNFELTVEGIELLWDSDIGLAPFLKEVPLYCPACRAGEAVDRTLMK